MFFMVLVLIPPFIYTEFRAAVKTDNIFIHQKISCNFIKAPLFQKSNFYKAPIIYWRYIK